MARTPLRLTLLLAIAALTLTTANAQLTNLPNLSSSASNGGGGTSSTGGGNTQTSSGGTQTSTGTSSTASSLTDAPSLSTSGLASATGTFTNNPFKLTGLPTIAGAGIPTLVIPYTANAPFMQKSSLPEGTFFIAVGATLAFLGACVLLWRAMVAWSVNRSVKRTALASMGLSEKSSSGARTSSWGGAHTLRSSSGYGPLSSAKGSIYKDAGYDAQSVSLEHLTSAGKNYNNRPPTSTQEARNLSSGGHAPPPPSNLFFSPTSQQTTQSRQSSGYMPSGYYASPSSHLNNGAQHTTIGGSLAPYAQQTQQRHSRVSNLESSRPHSQSSDGAALRAQSRDSLGSSLMVGQSGETSRAPSAYLEDLFENHGHGPRERY